MLPGIFGALGVILALVGEYGVMSYLVTQQTREIAIRVALGAESGSNFKLIASHCLKLTLAGVAAGLAISLALTRFVHVMFCGIRVSTPSRSPPLPSRSLSSPSPPASSAPCASIP